MSDKTGLPELGKFLASIGCEIISTGGTAKVLMKVTGVIAPDVSAASSLPDNVQQGLAQSMGNDMLTQAIVQMQEEFGVAYDAAVAELAISQSRY